VPWAAAQLRTAPDQGHLQHSEPGVPTNLVCDRCRLAAYNQNLRIDESLRSGARYSIFGFHRSYGIFIGPEARQLVNRNNRVIPY
jgi:hypothetical protein